MGHAVRCPTGVVVSPVPRAGRHVGVDPEKKVFEAFARVGHAAELEAGAGAAEGTSQAVGSRRSLGRPLQLRKQFLYTRYVYFRYVSPVVW